MDVALLLMVLGVMLSGFRAADEMCIRDSPGAVFGPKGLAVRQLKRYASWVQNVVRQFGPYLLRA